MASIFLANLDADAIGLGASCTRPEVLARDTQATRKRITLEAEDDNNVGFTPAGPIQALTNGSAQVSVSDCLACSGCVTSAESVLLAEQAAPKLALLCNEGRPVDVVLDRASLASVAQKFDSTPAEALARLRAACTSALPVRRVVAATDAQDLQLLETLHEFERRLERSDAGLPCSRDTPPPTVAVSATSYKDPKTNQIHEYTVEPKTEAPLPLVTSQCPGTVCFLEKTAPHALPFLSSTKSPMAAAAAVVKDAAVCYVGACADKKLEGYRRDLMDDDVPHVSLVLTLAEFVEAIGGDRLATTQAVTTEADLRDTRVHAHAKAASGGYADFVYRCVAGREPEWQRGRNNDVVECTLEREGLRPLKFAIATGFRNVQRVVAALKRTKPQYDFVELLACPVRIPCFHTKAPLTCHGDPSSIVEILTPLRGARARTARGGIWALVYYCERPLPRWHPTQSGCANGGGLLKGEKESRDEATARVAATLAKAHEAPAHDPRAGDDPAQRAALRPRLHTRHHRVPDAETSASSSLSLGNKW